MKNLLLDTHILLWYLNQQPQLPKHLLETIESSSTISVSAISCYEIAWLCRHQRIALPNHWSYQQWFNFIKDNTDIKFLDITPEIAQLAVELPQHHKDPHDRMIIATALYHNCHLMSVDGKFTLYDELSDYLIR